MSFFVLYTREPYESVPTREPCESVPTREPYEMFSITEYSIIYISGNEWDIDF
jgi:hypothetical protein